ncbi:MAG: hypothetical protein R3F62_07015 [Planctomycetota bacterium]
MGHSATRARWALGATLSGATLLVSGCPSDSTPAPSTRQEQASTLEAGRAALDADAPGEALRAANAALDTSPDDQEALLLQARALLGLGRSDEALRAIDGAQARGALKVAPPEVQRALYEVAVRALSRGLAREAERYDLLARRADYLERLDDLEASLADVEAALPLVEADEGAGAEDPDLARARLLEHRGELLARLERLDSGVEALLASAFAYTYVERHEDALRVSARAVELAPEDPAALAARGGALSAAHRDAEALIAYDSALERDPRNRSFLIDRALVRGQLGDLDGHLQDLESAAVLPLDTPGDDYARALLAPGLVRAGRFARATEVYASLCELQPTWQPHAVWYAALTGDSTLIAGRTDGLDRGLEIAGRFLSGEPYAPCLREAGDLPATPAPDANRDLRAAALASFHTVCGLHHEIEGDVQAALQSYRAALAARPPRGDAQELAEARVAALEAAPSGR